MLRAGPWLSPGVRRVIAGGAALLYGLVYLNSARLLPAAIFRDAQKIQDQMLGADTYAGSSFDAVGRLFAAMGPALDGLVMGAGAWFLWSMLIRAERLGLLAGAIVLAAPCVVFNLFVATKDTLVVVMALVIAAAAGRDDRPLRGWVAMLALYLVYAVTLRAYFALIAGLALGLYLLCRVGWRWRIVIVAALSLGMAWLPSAVFVALQQPRDLAVDYLVSQSPYGARTSFYNPFSPTSLAAFVGNYLYAMARLNLALLWSPGIKELAMQGWVLLAVVPPGMRLMRGMLSVRPTQAVPAYLVAAHIAVSMLFEPDLGSYMRHLSSVALLSMRLLTAGPGQGRPPSQ